MKRWLIRIALVVGVVLLAGVTFAIVIHEDRPVGDETPAADALAKKIQTAANVSGWHEIPAVTFLFGGRHEILWDKHRGFIRVRWGDNEIVRPVDKAEGVARVSGEPVDGDQKAALLEEGYAHWVNASFWLYPFPSFFAPNTTRSVAKNGDGEEGLLVSYGSGGVTPGDAYLWHVDASGRPTAWQMWVGIIPVGGLRVTWDDWETLNGVPFSTRHEMGPLTIEITELRVGPLEDIEPGDDPFAKLSAPLPSSQPTR